MDEEDSLGSGSHGYVLTRFNVDYFFHFDISTSLLFLFLFDLCLNCGVYVLESETLFEELFL